MCPFGSRSGQHRAVHVGFGTTPGMTLQQAVFAGKIDPGNLVGARSIDMPAATAGHVLPDAGLDGDCPIITNPDTTNDVPVANTHNCDIAEYSAPFAVDGVPTGLYTVTHNADGSVTVQDAQSAPPSWASSRATQASRTTLWNIEELRFCTANDAVTKNCTSWQTFDINGHRSSAVVPRRGTRPQPEHPRSATRLRPRARP